VLAGMVRINMAGSSFKKVANATHVTYQSQLSRLFQLVSSLSGAILQSVPNLPAWDSKPARPLVPSPLRASGLTGART